jgi:hypothetical protein
LKQTKATLSAALLLVIMVLGFYIQIPKSHAADKAVFGVVPATQTAALGEVFNVTITVDLPSPGAGGIEVNLTWDPTILTGVSMTEVLFHNVTPPDEQQEGSSNIWELANQINNVAGYAFYAYLFQDTSRATDYNPPYAPILGNHTLAIVTFEGIGTGFSSLNFQMIKVGDASGTGGVVPATGVGGMVKVGSPAPKITVVSPRNATYGANTVNVNFTLTEPAPWVGYSLDGTTNVTITGSTDISASDGQHSIVIYANDSAGRTGASDKIFFIVDTAPPIALFTYSPSPPEASYVFGNFRWNLVFNASASHGVYSNITEYFWDFGDGTNATGIAVSHQFRQSGPYGVKLNVTNSAGHSNTQVETVTLNPGSEPQSVPWLLVTGIVVPVVWLPLLLFYFIRTRRKRKRT